METSIKSSFSPLCGDKVSFFGFNDKVVVERIQFDIFLIG